MDKGLKSRLYVHNPSKKSAKYLKSLNPLQENLVNKYMKSHTDITSYQGNENINQN